MLRITKDFIFFIVSFKNLPVLIFGLWSFQVHTVAAHEINPAILNYTVFNTRIELEVRLTAEAILSGIDLSGAENAAEHENSSIYSELRALTAESMEQRLIASWPDISHELRINVDGSLLPLRLLDISVVANSNIDLARDTVLRLEGEIPPNSRIFSIVWPVRFGPFAIRDAKGGPDGYSAFVAAGAGSPSISLNTRNFFSSIEPLTHYIMTGFIYFVSQGLAHVLFILVLFLYSPHIRLLLLQLAFFTLAHTLTFASAMMGIIGVDIHIVEPLVAAAVALIAAENLTRRFYDVDVRRIVIIFCFGLLHGLGFAGAFGNGGLHSEDFFMSAAGFNIGVQLGQATIIAVAWLFAGILFQRHSWHCRKITAPLCAGILGISLYLTVERFLF